MTNNYFSKTYHTKRGSDLDEFLNSSKYSARTSSGKSTIPSYKEKDRYDRYGTTNSSRAENIGVGKTDYSQGLRGTDPLDYDTKRYRNTRETSGTDHLITSNTVSQDKNNLNGRYGDMESPRPALDTTDGTKNSSMLEAMNSDAVCNLKPVDNSQIDHLVSLVKQLSHIDIDSIESTLKGSSLGHQSSEQLQNLEREKEKLKDTLENLTTKLEKAESKNEELRSDAKKLIKDAKRKVMEEQEEKIQKLKSRVSELEDDRKQLRTEKDSALSRLSKEMGEKLNDNNPGIADLSDPNRSTKLAEKYLSLYDNDWTDALESLTHTNIEEEAGVRFLLEIVKHISEFCRRAKTECMMDIEGRLENPVGRTQSSETKHENAEDKQIRQLLDNCMKLKAATQITSLQKAYRNMNSTHKPRYADRLPEYVNKCVEICWLMNIQNPPLVFAEPQEAGEAVNKDLYKEYTRQGDMVSYIVWLPLLIEQGGAVLQKGVVQPVAKAARSREQPKKAWIEEKDTHNTDKNKDNMYGYSEYEKYRDGNDVMDRQKRNESYTGTQPKSGPSDYKVDDIFQDSRTSTYPSNTPSTKYKYTSSFSTAVPTYKPSVSSQQRATNYYNEPHTRTRSSEKALYDNQRSDTSSSKAHGSTHNFQHRGSVNYLSHIDLKNAELYNHEGQVYALYNQQFYLYDKEKRAWRLAYGFDNESHA